MFFLPLFLSWNIYVTLYPHTYHAMTLSTPILQYKLDDSKELVSLVLPLSVENIAVLLFAHKY